MVVKYGNIILLMETLINSTCYKVSTDVLYRLGFLSHTNLPVYTSEPNKCPAMWKRALEGQGRASGLAVRARRGVKAAGVHLPGAAGASGQGQALQNTDLVSHEGW